MKKLSELFEIVVNHFKKESPERKHQEVTEVEESEPHLSRSREKSEKADFSTPISSILASLSPDKDCLNFGTWFWFGDRRLSLLCCQIH